MNRTTIVALSVAAVLGATGGVAMSLQHDRTTPAGPSAGATHSSTPKPKPTSSDSPSPTGTPTPATTAVSGQDDSTNEPLLWASRRELHDGTTDVRLTQLHGEPSRIVRMKDGWVLTDQLLGDNPHTALWWIPKEGPQRQLATIVGSFDANAAGTKVTAYDASGKVRVWTPATGQVQTANLSGHGQAFAGFRGESVLISLDNQADGFGWQMFEWDPATGKVTDPNPLPRAGDSVSIGYPAMSVSPGGSYIAGAADNEGNPDPNGHCLHLQSTSLKKNEVVWSTCDWRAYGPVTEFSPDGTRLLAVPKETDGFGPGEYGVIDASDGPGKLVAKVPMPDWTVEAQWADNDHLYVIRATDGDAQGGYEIRRCDLSGDCSVAATSTLRPVVGSAR